MNAEEKTRDYHLDTARTFAIISTLGELLQKHDISAETFRSVFQAKTDHYMMAVHQIHEDKDPSRAALLPKLSADELCASPILPLFFP
jgi:hypothetical protein